MVTEGTVYSDTQWKLTTNNPITIGTTALTFTQNYMANSIAGGSSNVTVFSNANVTISSAGTANVLTISSTGTVTTGTASVTGNITGGNILTVGVVSASGNITANYFIGNGSQLTGIAGGGGTPGGANTQIQFNDGGTFGGTAGLTFDKTTNAVATTGTFSATGNIIGGNILGGANVNATTHTGTTVSVTANITGGNILTGGLVSATGAITGAALTGTSLTVSTGNITAGNLLISGAIIDSAQLDIQTSASNANIAMAPNGTGVVTVSTQVSAVGNITGGNIRTAGLISATGAITAGGDLSLIGNIVDTGPLSIITSSNGNINLAPNGTGNVNVTGNVMPTANATANIGSAALSFNTIFAKATSAQYADLAEMYVADATYAPGTVVEFGGDYEVTASKDSHSTRVAGIVSTNPSYLMNSAQTGEYVVAVALVGRVPCNVVGKINKGDRLVASNIPGEATRLIADEFQPGCIIGKALDPYDSNEVGTIEVAGGRT
jgi:hypothetical protein